MKKILGLDLGTNSIGWALVDFDLTDKSGQINGLGSRIIPMSQDILGKFDSGQSHSQTAERTGYRGVRRLYQRDNLRRERLHRVLNILGFLPEHYRDEIDFVNRKGQFKKEVKLNYRQNSKGKHEFIFMDSFNEMVNEFQKAGKNIKIPFDWTLYYLRKKALTQKISSQELAWIILNFNQKRGYYQLRSDEAISDENKNEKFYALKVVDVKATDQKKGDEIWYQVILDKKDEDGTPWIYPRKSKEPLDAWIGKVREFIVTEKTAKDGSLKRSFRSPNENDWGLVKKKTEQEIEQSQKHIGEYIFDTLLHLPNQKVRGKLIKTIERKYYKKELKAILEKQLEFHPKLRDNALYQACVDELYPRNEAHQRNIKDRDFVYLFLEDIIFYQRPLKSKKSTIAGCPFESKKFFKTEINKETGQEENKWHEVPIKVISKSNPLFQEFRLWQWLKNLSIYENEKNINGKLNLNVNITDNLLKSEDDWVDLFDFLNARKEVEQKHILNYFVSKKLLDKKQLDNYRWNYPEDNKYPCNTTRSSFLSRLKKVQDIDPESFLSKDVEAQLWHIIYSVKDPVEYEKALATFAKAKSIHVDSFVESFKKYPTFKAEYGAFSEKAIKKLLPLMRTGKYWIPDNIHETTQKRIDKIITGEYDEKIRTRVREKAIHLNRPEDFKGLPIWLASYVVYDRHSEIGDIQHWKTPDDIDKYLQSFRQHSLNNPIVEQVVMETLRTVRDIWKQYGQGEEGFFDEIHVELGREMKNPQKVRQNMAKRNQENQNTNERIRALLQEFTENGANPHSPSHQEILKIYEEGVVGSKPMSDTIEKIRKNRTPSKSDIHKYKLWLEQEYISPYSGKPIPLSKLFTTAYEIEHIIPQSKYWDNSLGNKVICETELNKLKGNQTAYAFIKKYGGQIHDGIPILKLHEYEAHCQKYFKSNRSKLKNLLSEDIPEGFINRQMNDSRYISKLVMGLLSNIVREKDEQEATSKNLLPVVGRLTSKLRRDWGLEDKWNELVLPRFKRMNELTKSEDYTYKNSQGIEIPTVPDDLLNNFSKKRIDHRHHAMDALVIACCTRQHTQYLHSLNNEKLKFNLQPLLMVKNDNGHYTKYFQLPWKSFPVDAKHNLDKVVISFKQNLRVINKTNNKTWQWKKQKDGKYKKELVRQTKGDSWAIRKPMHKETVSGKIGFKAGKGKIATAVRTSLSEIKNFKHLEKITDSGIKKILKNHLKNYGDGKSKEAFDAAFSPEGIQDLNKNIKQLNDGKNHQPIYKVRQYEVGSKFPVSENPESPKNKKYVEAAKGTNLFFAIYWDDKKQKRTFETVPLNAVIAHQKLVANLPKSERTPIPVDAQKGKFLFALSPNDLVFVPTDEELENPSLVDFQKLSKEQISRIFKVVSSTGNRLYGIPNSIAKPIMNKFEFSSLNKLEFDLSKRSIKQYCWKLQINRLGKITNYMS